MTSRMPPHDRSAGASEAMRLLPSVDALERAATDAGIFCRGEIRPLRAHLARRAIAAAREGLRRGGSEAPTMETMLEALRGVVHSYWGGRVRRVINATGIPLHTNLGRAPLDARAADRIAELARGYCDLEFDLDAGQRGSRGAWVHETLAVLTGAEAALAVNNGAAGLMLALMALCHEREAVVSRGEMVQVGGGFRIPDVMECGGARLREVGSTNITTINDYERVVWEMTGLILKVHRSNYTMGGHVEDVSIRELHALGARRGVPVIHDIGSGCLTRTEGALSGEMSVADSIHQGADLVVFSGDKLCGSAQAGLIVGKSSLITRLARHPLYRAVRPGRLVLAALQETLERYVVGTEETIPVVAMLRVSSEVLVERVGRWLDRVTSAGIPASVREEVATVGGGAAPDSRLPGPVLVIHPGDEARTAFFVAALRSGEHPVVTRVGALEVTLDPRTVFVDEEDALLDALINAYK